MIIDSMLIGSQELIFVMEETIRSIKTHGISFQHLQPLLKKIPELYDIQNLETLAKASNYLAHGLEFQYITNIEVFKQSYSKTIEKEKENFFDDKPKLTDYGIFDLSVMHPPLLKNSKLTFFVENNYLKIPYQTSFTCPISENFLDMSYELLPSIS